MNYRLRIIIFLKRSWYYAIGLYYFYLQGKIQFGWQPMRYTSRSSEISDNFVKRVVEKACRIDCYKKSFFPDCAARWNTLQSKIRVIFHFLSLNSYFVNIW